MTDVEPVVRVDGLTKDYGPVLALDALTLDIGGGTTGLVGANGAGKSTLLKILLGLVPPTGGRAEVLGHDIATEGEAIRAAVGYLPEHDCLPPDVSASDFVVHMAMMSGLPRVAARERAAEVLRHVGLAEERYRPMGGYSTGMKQKAKLAQALAHDPRLVLLDEPTNGLDPAARDEMLGLVRRIGHDFGIAVVVTSHLLGELERVSDHVVVLDGGRLLRASRTDEFLDATGVLLVEVLGDDGQARMTAALARRRGHHRRAREPAHRRRRRPPGRRARPHPRHRRRPGPGAGPPPGRPPPHRGRLRRRRRHRRRRRRAHRLRRGGGPVTDPSAATPAGGSVIHDLGYRPYTGPRLGPGSIARALTLTGFRNAFGLGRSGRSKVLPFALLALNLMPAVIVGGVLAFAGLDELPIGYAEYASTTQVLLGIFVAAQAPVLFSRDLRHGTISLYLARPLRSSTYAVAMDLAARRHAGVPPSPARHPLRRGAARRARRAEQTRQVGLALGLAVLLALSLTGIAGLVASWSTRRGFAVVATIALLVIANGIVTAIQGIAGEEGRPRIGEVAGLFSPYSLYRGLMGAWTDAEAPTPPTSTGMELAYVAVFVTLSAACLAALVWRYRRVATA